MSGSSSRTISGSVRKSHRDSQALALTHRHPVHPAAGELAQFEGVDRLLHGRPDARRLHQRNTRPELKLVANSEARVEAAVTGRQERDQALVAAAVLVGGEPPDLRAAAVWVDQAGGDPQQRGLARPIAPSNPGLGPEVKAQVHSLQHGRLGLVPALRHTLQGQGEGVGVSPKMIGVRACHGGGHAVAAGRRTLRERGDSGPSGLLARF